MRTLASYSAYLAKVQTSIRVNPKEIFKFIHTRNGTIRIRKVLFDDDGSIDIPEEIVNAFVPKFFSIHIESNDFSPKIIHSNCTPSTLLPTTEEEKNDKTRVTNYRPTSILPRYLNMFFILVCITI